MGRVDTSRCATRAVPRGDVRPEDRFLRFLADPEAVRGREDAEAGVCSGRCHIHIFEVIVCRLWCRVGFLRRIDSPITVIDRLGRLCGLVVSRRVVAVEISDVSEVGIPQFRVAGD